ncbi:hypothetical protein TWF694_006207 [Orbilia ellipsospora]|uniref:RING-type domain-containing protein n=1 Tax=Orbilia ellipsospora TaxID=2528407 RepID=A0AAV9XJE2_9PEZI
MLFTCADNILSSILDLLSLLSSISGPPTTSTQVLNCQSSASKSSENQPLELTKTRKDIETLKWTLTELQTLIHSRTADVGLDFLNFLFTDVTEIFSACRWVFLPVVQKATDAASSKGERPKKPLAWAKNYIAQHRAKNLFNNLSEPMDCFLIAIRIIRRFQWAENEMVKVGKLNDELTLHLSSITDDISALALQTPVLTKLSEYKSLAAVLLKFQTNSRGLIAKIPEMEVIKKENITPFETAAIQPSSSAALDAPKTAETVVGGTKPPRTNATKEDFRVAHVENETKLLSTTLEAQAAESLGIHLDEIHFRDPEIELPSKEVCMRSESPIIEVPGPATKNGDDGVLKIFVTSGESNYDRNTGLRINMNEPLNVYFDRLMAPPVDVVLKKLKGTSANTDALEVDFNPDFCHVSLTVQFHRTLRIPDDGKTYPLPPGLGVLPLYSVERFKDVLPKDIVDKGGALLPLYNREAFWISFTMPPWVTGLSQTQAPDFQTSLAWAIRIFLGGVNGISGEPMVPNMGTVLKKQNGVTNFQDYIVAPPQKWLDGIATAPGIVRQFVGVPRNSGYSVEQQVTGWDNVGGLQLEFIPRCKSITSKPSGRRNIWESILSEASTPLGGKPVRLGNLQGKCLDHSKTPNELLLEEGTKIVWETDNASKIDKLRAARIREKSTYYDPRFPTIAAKVYLSSDITTLPDTSGQTNARDSAGLVPTMFDKIVPFRILIERGITLELVAAQEKGSTGSPHLRYNDLVEILVNKTSLNPIGRKFYVGEEAIPEHGNEFPIEALQDAEIYWSHNPPRDKTASFQVSMRYLNDEWTFGPFNKKSELNLINDLLKCEVTHFTVNESDSVLKVKDKFLRESRCSFPDIQFYVGPPYFDCIDERNEPKKEILLKINQAEKIQTPRLMADYSSLASNGVKIGGIRNIIVAFSVRGTCSAMSGSPENISLSIGAGAKIKQTIIEDSVDPNEWGVTASRTFNITILDPSYFEQISGMAAPPTPINYTTYRKLGLPFFDIYNEPDSKVSGDFSKVKSVRELDQMNGVEQTEDCEWHGKDIKKLPCQYGQCDSHADIVARSCNHTFCMKCVPELYSGRSPKTCPKCNEAVSIVAGLHIRLSSLKKDTYTRMMISLVIL